MRVVSLVAATVFIAHVQQTYTLHLQHTHSIKNKTKLEGRRQLQV